MRTRLLYATRAVLLGVALAIGLVLALFPSAGHAQGAIPRDADRYRLTLTREARQAWGINAPVASFAAQVHQESRWNVNARSPVGAEGLAQFMPSTSTWISGVYASLQDRAPANPTWALRALVTYDRWLYDRVRVADNACERMAYAMSAYNGGLGWVYKRQAKSRTPGQCFGATCEINPGVSPGSQRENAQYPRVILLKFEPLYEPWGAGSCG